MTRPFKRYTLEEYVEYLRTYVGRVKFPEVHVHGTWKPTIAMFRAKSDPSFYIEAMYRTHTQVNGWSDIAQHATIDPDGYVWSGRDLTVAPASATGYNDSDGDGVHPFMFEMIGNFNAGYERLEGAQYRTAVGLTRALVDLFGSKIVFHREMTSLKTCPGSGIDKAEFVAAVNAFGTEDDDEMEKASVYVNGKKISDGLYDAKAGVTYVPVRAVSESFGASVKWNGKEKRVDITK